MNLGATLFRPADRARGVARARKPRLYIVVWWAYQRPYFAVTRDPAEATWTANLRNGVVVEVEGAGAAVKGVVDHWRRDAAGNPIPAELRDAAADLAPAIARRVRAP